MWSVFMLQIINPFFFFLPVRWLSIPPVHWKSTFLLSLYIRYTLVRTLSAISVEMYEAENSFIPSVSWKHSKENRNKTLASFVYPFLLLYFWSIFWVLWAFSALNTLQLFYSVLFHILLNSKTNQKFNILIWFSLGKQVWTVYLGF